MTLAIASAALIAVLQTQTADLPENDEPTKTEEVHGTLEYYCPPTCTLEQIIADASQMYGVPASRLACLVRRESTNNPNAVNGPYMGYTQFDRTTWALTPYAAASPFDGWANVHAAAFLISRGEGSRWPPLQYC